LTRDQPGEKEHKVSERTTRILVAEDNTVNQKVVVKQLQSLGYQAEAVNNGQEALDRIKEREYDLVLMDCLMPFMNGYQSTQEIRSYEGERKHTPIVGVSANQIEDGALCLSSGMDDYMNKPFSREELRKKVERWTSVTR
jgi:CheY-like chemotaxis protein